MPELFRVFRRYLRSYGPGDSRVVVKYLKLRDETRRTTWTADRTKASYFKTQSEAERWSYTYNGFVEKI